MRQVIEVVRLIAGVTVMFLLIILLSKMNRMNRRFLLSLYIYLTLFSYGLILAVINGGLEHVITRLPMNVAITVMGLFIFSGLRETSHKEVAKWFLKYSAVMLILTYVYGGLILSYPPRFHFEYVSTAFVGEVLYSQGVSSFFGLSAVIAVYVAFFHVDKGRIWYMALALVFLGLSLLGGARGDSLFAVLVVAGIVFFKSKWFFAGSILAVSFAFITLSRTIYFTDFTIVYRLIYANNPFGYRDILWDRAIELLMQEPGCLIFGCGFGYYQTYYNFESGLYPHNLIIESMITWGVPLTFLLIVLFTIGFFRVIRATDSQFNLISAIFIYLGLISLKSGELTSAWIVLIGLFQYTSIAIERKPRRFVMENQKRFLR